MLRKIILDNTVFNRFVWMQSVELLQMLQNLGIEQILIPEKVKEELQVFADGTPHAAPRLSTWLNAIRPNSFFHLCTSEDPVVFAIMYSMIDEGEAHAIAQSVSTSVSVFITDDFSFEKKLPPASYYPRLYSSFFLLAYADATGFLAEKQYKEAFAEILLDMNFGDLTPKKKREHRQRWQNEYAAALRHLSLPLDKKLIRRKIFC